MLKIRLQKIGKKNAPSYRVILAEHTSKPQGKFIEILGNYNPRLKQKAFKTERIKHWLDKGAQASPTVHNLLIDAKIVEGEKVKAWKPKKRAKAKSAEARPEPSEGGKKETESPSAPEGATEDKKPLDKPAPALDKEPKID